MLGFLILFTVLTLGFWALWEYISHTSGSQRWKMVKYIGMACFFGAISSIVMFVFIQLF